MQDFPHHYRVTSHGAPTGTVGLTEKGVTPLQSGPPVEFGGEGGLWSPESLLVAAVADCFVLSFRAVAHASRVEWESVACDATGVLDRVERVTRFTGFTLAVSLVLPEGTDEDKARRALDKAESACLVTNSLDAAVHVEATITRAA